METRDCILLKYNKKEKYKPVIEFLFTLEEQN